MMKMTIDAKRFNYTIVALAAMVLFYLCFVGSRSIYAYMSFNSVFDAAVFNNAFWNTIKGNGLFYNAFEGGSHFRLHFSPIMFLMLPIYWILPDYQTLLGLETLAMAAGIPAVYLLARERLSQRTSLLFGFLYMASHIVQGINLVNCEGFHPIAFSIPLLLYSLYFLRQDKIKLFWLCFVLVLACREDTALVGMFYGLYILIIPRRKTLGIAVLVTGLVWFVLSIEVIIPFFRGGSYVVATPGLSRLGGSVTEIIVNAFKSPYLVIQGFFEIQKLEYLLRLFLPLFFLPLFSPKDLIPCLPQLLINLTSSYAPNFIASERYTSVIIPFLFMAAINGTSNLDKISGALNRQWLKKGFQARYFLWFSSLITVVFLVSQQNACTPYVKSETLLPLRRLADKIPEDYTVSFSNHSGLARFSYRKEIRYLSLATLDSDVVIVDRGRPHISWISWDEIKQCERIVKEDHRYKLVYDHNNLKVYSQKPLPLKDIIIPGSIKRGH